MSVFSNISLQKDLKAYEQSNDPPIVGDIRPTKDYPAGTKLAEITQFEVWDGSQWVNPQKVYELEPSEPTGIISEGT